MDRIYAAIFIGANLEASTVIDWIFVFFQSSYAETLPSSVMAAPGGAFERYLGLDEVMRVGSSRRD